MMALDEAHAAMFGSGIVGWGLLLIVLGWWLFMEDKNL
jgi:hypothetical protein